ncbi:MAG: ATP-binding protein [Gemmatirosa sp.]
MSDHAMLSTDGPALDAGIRAFPLAPAEGARPAVGGSATYGPGSDAARSPAPGAPPVVPAMPAEAPSSPPVRDVLLGSRASPLTRWAVAAAAGGVGVAATVASSDWLGAAPTTTLAMAAIVASATYGGFGAGALTTALCALGMNWFLSEPRHSLAMARTDEMVRIGLLTVVGLAVSLLGGRVRRAGARVAALADTLARHNAALDARNRQVAAQAALLSETEAEFRAMAENIPQLAWMARPDGRIDWYNQRWYAYTGTTPEQMQGWGRRAVHHPDHVARVAAGIRRSRDTGEPWEDTFPLRSKDGEWRWFLSRASPIRDAGGRIVRWFGTHTDVTAEHGAAAEREQLLEVEHAARAHAEEAREAAEEARRAAVQANEVKGRFFAMMSHELRTPINAIVGHVQLVELGLHGPVTEAQRGALARVQQASRHLLGLVNDVLDYAKLEAGRVEYALAEVDLREAVEAAVPLVEPQRQAKRQTLTVAAPETACLVWADGDKLRQVLLNLLSNAVKFTPEGGAIRMRVEMADHTPSVAVVQVADTGIGIPGDRLETIFAPFVQVASDRVPRHEGTGLGLAISRDLARGMGGDLTAASTEGEGSVFSLSLRRVVTATGARTDRRFRDDRRDAGERRHPTDRRTDGP